MNTWKNKRWRNGFTIGSTSFQNTINQKLAWIWSDWIASRMNMCTDYIITRWMTWTICNFHVCSLRYISFSTMCEWEERVVILTAQTMFKLERIYYYPVTHLSPILYPFKSTTRVTPLASNPYSMLPPWRSLLVTSYPAF